MRRYRKLLQWILVACCLAYISWFFLSNTDDLKLALRLSPFTLAALTGLCVTGQIIYAWRFQIILQKCSEKKVPFRPWLSMVIVGQFLNLFAPQAGNIYRSVSLKSRYQVSYTRYISSFFSINWIDTCLNLTLALLAVLIMRPDLQFRQFRASHVLLVLIVAVAMAPVILKVIIERFNLRNKTLSWIHSRLSQMLSVSVDSVGDMKFMLKIISIGIVSFANTMVLFYICFHALAIPIELPTLTFFYVVLKLCDRLVITPGNLGVREIAYGIISAQMEFGMAQGMMVSIVIRVIGTTVITVMGLICGGLPILKGTHEAPNTDRES